MHRTAATPWLILAAGWALGGLGTATAQAARRPVAAATTELPRTVRPRHYDIALVPDATALSFTGQVEIALDVLRPTRSITLNAAELRFTSARLVHDPGGPTLPAPRVVLDDSRQTAAFEWQDVLPRGRYRLALEYTGVIRTQATGLFALDYQDAGGSSRALYTKFESADARSVVPCWDEPAYKATFTLTATVAADQLAVSNMPVASRADVGAGRVQVRFATSPPMSTYLLFFAAGDFERMTMRVDGTELGVVTRRGASPQAAFALASSGALLAEFNDYFGVRYPLPKLDNVAAPGASQRYAAMENWGAIQSFESVLLLDPSLATQADRESLYSIAAHEISHQWFGDLVTMRWWDDLWLNEGFAAWLAARTLARLHPEWGTTLERVGDRERALSRDAFVTTHPVVQPVATVAAATLAFDAITYQKGQAVIQMLEAYVGEAAWRAAIRGYLRRYAYTNTVSADLWRAVEAASGKPVRAIAAQFTRQPGVPLIEVIATVCDHGQTRVELRQREFTVDRAAKRPLSWWVPVIVATADGGARGRVLVRNGRGVVSLPGCGPVVVNAGQSGYYRTHYAPQVFRRLATEFGRLAPVDQLGLFADSAALGLAGLQPVTDVLELLEATPVTADPHVWGSIATLATRIDDSYAPDPAHRAAFRRFAIARLAPVLAQVGWTAQVGEPGAVATLRNRLIGALGAFGDVAIVAEARRRYHGQTADPELVPAALRKTILGVVARHADTATWEELHALALAERTPLLRSVFYHLLSSTADDGLAARTLALALTSEPSATDCAGMIRTVAVLHPDLAFDFALSHRAAVLDRVDPTSHSSYFARLAEGSGDPAMIEKLRAYALAYLAPDLRREVDAAAARVADRIRVRTERLPAIDAWLELRRG